MAKILFSCVGNTDPMNQNNFHDGPLLHIIRYYQPEKVYLYMSEEMQQHHIAENRYEPYIKDLARRLDYDIDINYINSEIKEVYKFDVLLKEFNVIIEQMHQDNPEMDILFNASSGTPAMKSAITVLSSFLKYPSTVIQVLSPEVGTHDTPANGLDWETLWELNVDNDKSENRCEEVTGINLNYEIQKNAIEILIRQYDYAAAYALAVSVKELMDKKALELILAQKHRKNLDWMAVDKTLNLATKKELITLPKNQLTFEYFLKWKSDFDIGDYRSFIVGLTPLFTTLMQEIITKFYPEQKYWHPEMVRGKQRFIPDVQAAIDQVLAFSSQKRNITNKDLSEVVGALEAIPDTVKDRVKTIRRVEESIRNKYAHQVRAISKNELEGASDIQLEHLISTVWSIFVDIYSFPERTAKLLKNAYDEVNNEILALL
ncbi:MAG: type III-A CRISPR-associated CARF protein Csm6 [Peptococcus niger]|nr:hypothetical protein [Peptococcus niger]